MYNFETVRLETLCTDVIDCPHSTPVWRDEGIFVVRNFNIKQGCLSFDDASYVDEETYNDRIRRARPEPGDLIISREAPMGVVCMVPEGVQCCLGQRLVLLKIDKEVCDPNYLLFAIQSQFVQAQIKTVNKTGSIVSNLNIPDLKALQIPFVEKPVQKKIGNILVTIVNKIQLNNRIIAELESMAKTIYDYWFVQFDFPDAEGRPYHASGGEMIWSEKLKREIPKGWIVSPLPKECLIIDCSHSAKPDMTFESENYYLLQLENLVDHGLVNLGNKYYVTKEMYELWTSRIEVVEGDLVITNAGRIGSVARIPHNVKAGIGRNMTAIRPKNIPPCYLYYYITGSDVAGQIRVNTDTGSFFGSLNVRGIKELLMTLPPGNIRGVLNDFDTHVYPLRREIEMCTRENQELANLRDWLLPMLMNGQVTVK